MAVKTKRYSPLVFGATILFIDKYWAFVLPWL